VRPAAAVIGLLCALAVLVWAPGAGPAGTREPPAAPHNGVLRTAKGTIWWVDRTCRIWQLRLPGGDLVRGGAGHCHVWPSPSGRLALASQDDPQSPRPPASLKLLARDGLHVVGVIGVRSDAVSPGVTWTPDSSAVAFCTERGPQQAVEVVRVPAVSGIGVSGQQFARVVEKRCHPAFMLNSALATSDRRHVYLAGKRLSIDRLLTHLTGGGPVDVRVTAMAASPAGLVIAVARNGALGVDEQALLVTVRGDGGVIRVDHPPRGLIDTVSASPDGAWLAIEYAFSGQVRLIRIKVTSLPAVPEVTRSLAWSPDGRFVAVALSGELRIVDMFTGASTSLTEVRPTSLSWTQ
jgi:WD40 repeat protein